LSSVKLSFRTLTNRIHYNYIHGLDLSRILFEFFDVLLYALNILFVKSLVFFTETSPGFVIFHSSFSEPLYEQRTVQLDPTPIRLPCYLSLFSGNLPSIILVLPYHTCVSSIIKPPELSHENNHEHHFFQGQ